jgi:6-phosphofructokinase
VKLPPEMKENRRASSVGNLIGNSIAHGSHKEVRVSVLGHIQRGGSHSPFDASWLRASAWLPSIWWLQAASA